MSDFQKISIVGPAEFDSEGKLTVTVKYEASSALTNGVGFKLHFDGDSLEVDSIENVFAGATASGAQAPGSIDVNGHADDQELSFGWAAISGNFPGTEQADLATITFSEVPGGSDTNIYVSKTSGAVGYEFINDHAIPAIPLDITELPVNENSGENQVIATVANGPSGATYELVDNTVYSSEETQVIIPQQATSTQHLYVSESTLSDDGTQVTVKVAYMADNPETNGVGFKLNFDSSALSLNDVSGLFAGATASGAESAGGASDQDPSTDRELSFGWASISGNFPGADQADLATIVFDVVPGAGGATPINLTKSSGAVGYDFDGQEHVVQLPASSPLSIDSSTGAVSLSVNPDFESVPSYDFEIVTADGAYGSSASVNVVNVDESAAIFDSASGSNTVAENATVIYTAVANDSADVSAGVTYSLSGADASLLNIDANTGEVTVIGGPDYETKTSYSFTVAVTDGVNAPGPASEQAVTVAITNVDDTGPVFTVLDSLSVNENETGLLGAAATAVDDQTDMPSGSISYSLADDANGAFSINSGSGAISIVQAANHEAQSSYDLVITAEDGNGNTTDQTVTIAIVNVDEVAPTITSADAADAKDENFLDDTDDAVVYTATADDDADFSGGFTFSLAGDDASKFSIDSATGAVTIKENPDYEVKSSYSFDVVATDAAGLFGSKSVTLLINDVADAKPIFDSGDAAAAVDENTGVAVVYTANANAVSPEGETVSIASYELTDDANGAFTIDADTGVVSFAGGADFETQSEYSFTVKATDDSDNANSSEQTVTLNITNVDDTAPVVKGTDGDKNLNAYTGEGQVVFNAQNPIQGEQAFDDDSLDVTSALTFEIVQDGGFSDRFDVDANGVVTYNLDPKLDDNLPEDQESQTIPYSLKVTDAAGNESVLNLQITISGAELNIPEFDTPAGYTEVATADVVKNAGTDNEDTVTVVTEVSGDLDGVADGDVIYTAVVEDATPVTYAVGTTVSMPENGLILHSVDASAAALTSGHLSVDPAGVVTIHGQPWEDGATEFNFTVTATDASGNVANQSVTLDVTGYTGGATTLTGVTYGLESSNGEALVDSEYAIDRDSGEITFVGSADYEARPNYDFNVVVSHDSGAYSYGIFLAVEDATDTGPAITSATSVSVTENTDLVYQVTSAADNDNDNVGVVYGVEGADASAFNIDAGGNVTLAGSADHEAQSEYSIVVTATANGQTSEQAVTVTVDDVDEYGPVFSSANAISIDENETGTIYTASAHDIGSVDSVGAINQEFVQNDDGTLTVKFSVNNDVYSGVSELEVADFDFSFEADQDGVLAVESIEFPANPMVRLVNDDVDGQINFALIFRDKFEVGGDLALAEVTFKVGDPSVSTQFSVSDISLGDAGSAEPLAGSSVVNYVMDAPSTASFALENSDGFAIDAQGNVTVTDADFEASSDRSFTVIATDANGNSTSKSVNVSVNNLDEVAPDFVSDAVAAAIDENSGSGQVVYTASAEDIHTDEVMSAGVTFSLEGLDAGAFVIDAQSGEVTLLDNPDYETQSAYSFTVKASDGVHSSTKAVSLAINNLDEVAPEFLETPVDSVDETTDFNEVIYDADHSDVHDNESETNGVTYSLASTNTDTLVIDQNGVVRVTGSIDHETLAQYSFTVVATDAAGNASKQAITVDVNDVDETKPVFISGTTALNIDENASGDDLVVYKIIADDSSDVVGNGEISYGRTLDGDYSDFNINSTTGEVTLKDSPDFEDKSEYSLTVRATDESGNTSTETITIKVNDLDEKAPEITSADSAGSIVENSGTNQVVYTATAIDVHTDEATSGGFKFALAGTDADAFTIDAATGEVRLIDNPDHDEQSQYSFSVTAEDAAGHISQAGAVTLAVTPESEVTVAHWGSDVHIGKVKITSSDKVVETDGLRSASITVDEDASALSTEREVEVSDVSGVINSADALQVLNIAARSATISDGREYKYDAANDFDGDGKVNDFDITMMAADINGDGKVNSRDALEILKISVRMDDALDTEWMFAEVNADANTQDTAAYVGFVRGDVNASWKNAEQVDATRQTDKGATFTTAESVDVVKDSLEDTVIYKVAADDDTFEVSYSTEQAGLAVGEKSGIVTVTDASLVNDLTSFDVIATDADGNESTQTVTVSVVDPADAEAPVIDSSVVVSVSEIDTENTAVYTASATDNVDSAAGITFTLAEGHDPALSIDDGVVYLSNKRDEDIQSEYHFTLVATDSSGNQSKQKTVIEIDARDEVDPVIVSSDGAVSIDEHVDGLYESQVIYKAKATDADHDGQDSVSYSLKDDPSNLSIDADGAVTLTSAPDYETGSEITFTVVATDGSGNDSEKEVTIAVNDLDEKAPEITSSDNTSSIKENSGAGQLVYTASASDVHSDEEMSEGVSFSLTGTGSEAFTIDATSGEVRLVANPNFELQEEYSLTVEAKDAAGRSSTQSLTLSIDDVDEDAPEITLTAVAASVTENSDAGQTAYTVSASDASGEPELVLSADSDKAVSLDDSGNIVLNESPDHEMQREYNFTVIATDSEGNSSQESATITVNDVDDAAPRINSESSKSVAEGNVSGDVIYRVASEDTADMKAAEDTVSYALLAGKGSEQKSIADTQLVYVGSDTLQKDDQIEVAVNYLADSNELTGLGLKVHYDSSKLEFVAMNDLAANVLFHSEVNVNSDDPSASYVSVVWADISALGEANWTGGDLPELLANVKFDVIASEATKSEISFSAIDTAAGYEFVGVSQELKLSPVTINTETGDVSLTAATDYEASDEVSFTVVAEDKQGNSSTQSVRVAIDNIDDTAPVITTESVSISLDEIHENSTGAHKIHVYSVAADDSQDINYGDVTYKLANHDSSLAIDSASGDVYFISHPDFELNYDADTGESKYEFTVVAEDAAGIQSSKQVTLNINNIDEKAPLFTSDAVADSVDENTEGAQLVYTAASTDNLDITDNNTTYSLTADSDGAFSVVADTGEVYFNESANYEDKSQYNFTVVATDAGGNSRVKNVSLQIGNLDEQAPVFSESSDAVTAVENTDTFGLFVSADDVADTSDGVNYHLIGDDAELFDVSGSGLITQGDNTEFDYETKSEYNFTVVATDEAGNSSVDSQQDVTVTIVNADEVNPEVTSAATAQAVVAADPAAVIYTATAADSGDGSNGNVAYSVTGNSDVSIDPVSGDVSVNNDATLSTTVDFTVVATDDEGNSSEKSVSIPVISSVNTVDPVFTTGGIVHTYTHNSDGTLTLKLSIAADTGIEDQDITNLDFNLEYNSALAAFDGYPDSIASNPDMHIATPAVDSNNDDIANTLSFSQVYMNGYDTAAGLAIFEHTFELNGDVSGDLFTVSSLTIGEDDTAVDGSASSLASLPANAGTNGDDVVALTDGFASVNLGEGSDTLIIDPSYSADIVVDFESSEDSIDVSQILQANGYGEGDALQVSGSTPDIADLVSNSDESLDNAFGGYFNDETDVLTLFVDADSAAGVTNVESIEVTLSDSSSFEDDDLSVNYENFASFIA